MGFPPRRPVRQIVDHEPVIGTWELVRIDEELRGAPIITGELGVSPVRTVHIVEVTPARAKKKKMVIVSNPSNPSFTVSYWRSLY